MAELLCAICGVYTPADPAAIAAGLTKAQRDDLSRATYTNGRWWVPCPASRAPLVHGGDLTPLGLAVRAALHDTVREGLAVDPPSP